MIKIEAKKTKHCSKMAAQLISRDNEQYENLAMLAALGSARKFKHGFSHQSDRELRKTKIFKNEFFSKESATLPATHPLIILKFSQNCRGPLGTASGTPWNTSEYT